MSTKYVAPSQDWENRRTSETSTNTTTQSVSTTPTLSRPEPSIFEEERINIAARIAKRVVNVELLKVGNLIMSGIPKLQRQMDDKLYWEVPFLVVPPDDDFNTYPIGMSAFVDAKSGLYVLEEEDIQKLRAVADPILDKLYPDLEEYVELIREVRSKL